MENQYTTKLKISLKEFIMNTNSRLDILLKHKFNFSREYSKEIIYKGYVKVDGKSILKPSFKVNLDTLIELDEKGIPKYVSRGGLKLEKAINLFKIDLNSKICLDIGASKGGFTDCMLKFGASKVYAVDVGTNQLDEKLLINEKVISLENTDIRNLKNLDDDILFISTDVSFISIEKIIRNAFSILHKDGEIILLIKPQFELGKKSNNKKGVIKNKKVHKEVIQNIIEFSNDIGLFLHGFTFSPITGKDGNIEYLAYMKKYYSNLKVDFEKVILSAFECLK